MGITSDQILASAVLITIGLVVFARARLEYERFGKLNPLTGIAVILTFALQFASAVIFLHPSIKMTNVFGLELFTAIFLFALGVTGLVIACTQLGLKEAIGINVSQLTRSGRYRFSRNPQLIAFFLLQIGFVLLWTSWSAILWLMLFLILTIFSISVEEEHLGRIYGEDYYEYCLHTPRFIGITKNLVAQRRSIYR